MTERGDGDSSQREARFDTSSPGGAPNAGGFDSHGIDALFREATGLAFPAASVAIRHRGAQVFSSAYGACCAARNEPEALRSPLLPDKESSATTGDTLFDIASVSKLFVVTAFMTLVEEGLTSLDAPVSTILPEFSGFRPIQPYEDPLTPGAMVEIAAASAGPVDAGAVRFRDLLRHASGLPAWRPLFRQKSPELARRMILETFFSYPTGTRVIYSDIGLILIGMAVERLSGMPLSEAVRRRVTKPLGLARTSYRPIGASDFAEPGGIAPTELCAWRDRRIVGEVHDENCYSLGGVTGHAGIFSTSLELSSFGQFFLDAYRGRSSALLNRETVFEMARLQAEDGAIRRGLGFALWSPDPASASNPLGQRCFGHLGFTGTSLWIDPDRELVIACLTNRVYYGRDPGPIGRFRIELHRAIAEAVDRMTVPGNC